MNIIKWLTGLFLMLGVPTIIILVLVKYFWKDAKKYLKTKNNSEINTGIEGYVKMKEGQTQAEVKKRYLYCSQCKKYTRHTIHTAEFPINPLFYFFGLFTIKSFAQFAKQRSQRQCKYCNNRNGLEEKFLTTIVNRNMEEIAYFLPSGERVKNSQDGSQDGNIKS